MVATLSPPTAVNFSFTECLREFMHIQRHSSPVGRHQLEASGGTLYDTMECSQTSFCDITIEDWDFIIDLCLSHSDVDCLVVCVLRIMSLINLEGHTLLLKVNRMPIFFIQKHSTKRDVCWSLDLVEALSACFCESMFTGQPLWGLYLYCSSVQREQISSSSTL
jgi:hypothetical protein